MEGSNTLRDYISIETLPEKINRKLKLSLIPFHKKPLDYEIDYIIKFENINNDFKIVCENLNIPYTPLPHRNKSDKKHYSKYYDEELIDLVKEKFKEEVEFGTYTFETQ